MKQPDFWFQPPGLLASLLSPLGKAGSFVTRIRLRRGDRQRVGVPVICAGNLNVGGTGKTPFVIALLQRLLAAGETPHAVSRGYGGRTVSPTLVDVSRHSAVDVGDEPLLLAQFAPTWVGNRRLACARAAVEAGASVIVLDDGHQDPSLAHDLPVVVVDAARGFGNGLVMPAGPLREPVSDGLRRAGLLVIANGTEQHLRKHWTIDPELPVVEATTEVLHTGKEWRGDRVVAFAGIGNPARFFACLAGQGAEIVKEFPLSDHQPLDSRLLARLQAAANANSAQLVTTEKDAVRLPPDWRNRVLTFPVRMTISDWSEIDQRLVKLGLAVPATEEPIAIS